MSEPICGHDGLSQFYDNSAGRMRCRDCIVERVCNPIRTTPIFQKQITDLASSIAKNNAKMGGCGTASERLIALRDVASTKTPSDRLAAVQYAIANQIFTREEGIELCNMGESELGWLREVPAGAYESPEIETRDPRPPYEHSEEPIDPRWEECVVLKTAVAVLKKDLDAERQRANRLGDEAASLRALRDALQNQVSVAHESMAGLESKARSDARTIARLKAEISLLKRACR